MLTNNVFSFEQPGPDDFNSYEKVVLLDMDKKRIQSALVISKSKEPSETLRDIRISDVQN